MEPSSGFKSLVLTVNESVQSAQHMVLQQLDMQKTTTHKLKPLLISYKILTQNKLLHTTYMEIVFSTSSTEGGLRPLNGSYREKKNTETQDKKKSKYPNFSPKPTRPMGLLKNSSLRSAALTPLCSMQTQTEES